MSSTYMNSAAGEDARVGGGRERVVHADVGAVGAAQRGALADVEGRARLVAHRGHHLEPRARRPARRSGVPRSRRRGAGRLDRLGRRRAALVAREVAHGAARDPQEEQVEDGEEAELERDRERLVHRRLLELEGQVRDADRDAVAGAKRRRARRAGRSP